MRPGLSGCDIVVRRHAMLRLVLIFRCFIGVRSFIIRCQFCT